MSLSPSPGEGGSTNLGSLSVHRSISEVCLGLPLRVRVLSSHSPVVVRCPVLHLPDTSLWSRQVNSSRYTTTLSRELKRLGVRVKEFYVCCFPRWEYPDNTSNLSFYSYVPQWLQPPPTRNENIRHGNLSLSVTRGITTSTRLS